MTDDIMEKVAEVAPTHVAFLQKTAAEINASPFKEEILEELDGLTKKAMNWGGVQNGAASMGRGMASFAGGVGAAAAGGIAMALAGDLYSAAKRGITKSRDFKNMLDANPQLSKAPAKDVQKAFSVLHRFNPEFAADPTVSGAWVGKQINMPDEFYGETRAIKELIDSHKSIVDSNKLSPFKADKGSKQAPPGRDDLRAAMGMGPTYGGPPGGRPVGRDEHKMSMKKYDERLGNIEKSMQQQPGDFDLENLFQVPGGGHTTKPPKK